MIYLHLYKTIHTQSFITIYIIYNSFFIQIKTFIKILEEKVNVDKKTFSTKELKEFAMSNGILINDFAVLISRLNEEGILLKIKKDTYKFIYCTT